jgi:hypothetical protein
MAILLERVAVVVLMLADFGGMAAAGKFKTVTSTSPSRS